MKLEQIFRYEIYKINNYLILDSPLINIKNPTFLLDKTTLYIYLEQSSIIYYYANLSDVILESIANKTCYIREINNSGTVQSHQILI